MVASTTDDMNSAAILSNSNEAASIEFSSTSSSSSTPLPEISGWFGGVPSLARWSDSREKVKRQYRLTNFFEACSRGSVSQVATYYLFPKDPVHLEPVDINIFDNLNGSTCLMRAAIKAHFELVSYLLGKGGELTLLYSSRSKVPKPFYLIKPQSRILTNLVVMFCSSSLERPLHRLLCPSCSIMHELPCHLPNSTHSSTIKAIINT